MTILLFFLVVKVNPYPIAAIVEATQALKSGATPSQAASLANQLSWNQDNGWNSTRGAAVGGSLPCLCSASRDDGTITVTPYSGGLAVLPPGKKGAIIHLINTPGNPMYGTADCCTSTNCCKYR